jgi:hypothetical protein
MEASLEPKRYGPRILPVEKKNITNYSRDETLVRLHPARVEEEEA